MEPDNLPEDDAGLNTESESPYSRFAHFVYGIEKQYIEGTDDAIILVIGDSGSGKSTFMLEFVWLWQQITQGNASTDSILSSVVPDDRQKYREAMLNGDRGDVFTIMDAQHVLHNREAMHGDQINLEKLLLDIRTFGYVNLFGFHNWRLVPNLLKSQRTRFALRLDREQKGRAEVYDRDKISQKYKTDEWPDPAFTLQFPALDTGAFSDLGEPGTDPGVELFRQFNELDVARKKERNALDQAKSGDDVKREEHIKTVLRAVKPWRPDGGMTQTDASELVNKSQKWVSNRISEWENGRHRDLFEEEEQAAIETFTDSSVTA